ncbi:NAD-glutamate dehydrogenase [Actinopolymorpha rutila]|uniref:Glutamate dehydrogenase n=1 Tax=Actinopolymorpha rutila TaxID=446787 RepID=A0A852ZEN5_9ACTN|nr:NAD-glutamate dehydrogenase [Actinopolymorpha rutila]NYH91587.1 glutamate dehydrogenase [Actinopolymorpha rutila]
MTVTGSKWDDAKDAILADAAKVAEHSRSAGALPPDQVERLLAIYYRHVSAEDLLHRDPVDVYGAARSHYRLAQERPQGTAAVNVFTPTVEEHGWSCSHTVVEVVTDDMPFLVDSVTMELSRRNHGIHLVVHPQVTVHREITGKLLGVEGGYNGTPATAPGRREPDLVAESWIHVEIDRVSDPDDLVQIEADLRRVLNDVRESVEDWEKLQARALEVVEDLATNPPPLPEQEIADTRELLTWLADNHFTFLGYREYTLHETPDGDSVMRAVPGKGLGILRSDPRSTRSFRQMPPEVRTKAKEKRLLILTKANSRSTVHRPAYLDYIGIKTFDESGEVVGERRFLGLFTSAVYTQSVRRIPVLRARTAEVLERSGFSTDSHSGKVLLDILETYPRDELFQVSAEELLPTVMAVLYLQERRRLRLFVRRDDYGRYVSCLVYLPRDRFSTDVRLELQRLLLSAYGGETIDFALRLSESVLARLHFVIRMPRGAVIPDLDVAEVEEQLSQATRTWSDDFADALNDQVGEAEAARLLHRYDEAFPVAYRDDFPARTGVADLLRLEELPAEGGLGLSLYEPVDAASNERRFKIYRTGQSLSLSDVLPRLTRMGVEVIDERPYEIETADHRRAWIYDFGLVYDAAVVGAPAAAIRELFQDAFAAVWSGRAESDGFNALVLRAGLDWRQASILRAYAKYMRQSGSTFSQSYIEDALTANVDLACLLVSLFEARFDPRADQDPKARDKQATELVERIESGLDDVVSLDHDRILRSLLNLVRTTLRTNYFQRDTDGEPKPYISFKLDPRSNPELPEPRPQYEIWVYSPRVEGVHLRFGPVARGGLRWSDRREDFRTEVLGLAKAQMVKNTVIVPVGAKGGFFCKQLPDPADRDAWMAEGVASYRTFISGLLDITDNLRRGEVIPPADVVRHDGDDAYLVVAADKGTASFSDIANDVAKSYGFWLGDAFASGGSDGYDHKAMGITARGAWESVKRHFRELGRDCQHEDFTCVGVGDMSGDVFGNGMLCSRHTRLVAAFDHRHIFLDPDPDPDTSYDERRRLFDLPRSSWADYDRDLISTGGGVYRRTAKSIPLSPQVRASLGIARNVDALTPSELIRAILTAPVDLLWNGGIGTYVKASAESQADAGDKANDAVRVNGRQLRAACVGEGGNLGLTQLGRIEYAQQGGKLTTDFIDNSAGVDTSDHEVNIKVLLDRLVQEGDLTGKQRNEMLAGMTDEVAQLVLDDNYQQNVALQNAAAGSKALMHVHADWIRRLEKLGLIDRELEFLPNPKQFRERQAQGGGLTAPELAVLFAYTKVVLASELLGTSLPDDPYLNAELVAYFPEPMRKRFQAQMAEHPLRREIITTQVVNRMVNMAGMTFYPRLSLETGAPAEELARAHVAARAIFGADEIFAEIQRLDNRIESGMQVRMRLEARTIAERASRWFVQNRRPPMDVAATIEFFAAGMRELSETLPDVLTGRERTLFEGRLHGYVEAGVPEELATRVAALAPTYAGLGIVETAKRTGVDLMDVARVHFILGERLELGRLLERILALPRPDRWQTTARATLRDDLHNVHAQLTLDALSVTPDDAEPEERVAAWAERDRALVTRTRSTLGEIVEGDVADLARLSVGLRVVRRLLPTAN